MYVEIPSIDNDPYVPDFTYRYIPDIQKVFKVTTLLKKPHEGISERNFEIHEGQIKEDFLGQVYTQYDYHYNLNEGMTSHTLDIK